MKLEDLYKSELSDLQVQPKQGGYERVKTALVHRIVKNALIFSIAFIMFFVGLGELAKYKKTQANKEFKFPSKFFKSNENQLNLKERSIQENASTKIVLRNNRKTMKSGASLSNFALSEQVNAPAEKRFFARPFTFVEQNREKYFGDNILATSKMQQQSENDYKKGLSSFDSQNIVHDLMLASANKKINTKSELNEKKAQELATEDAISKEKKDDDFESFPMKKNRKIKFYVAAFSGYDKTIQTNDYRAAPYYNVAFGIVYPILKSKFNARLGGAFADHNYTIKNAIESKINNRLIEVPLSIEYPIHLIGKTNFIIGVGSKLVNVISHKEKSTLSDGSNYNQDLYSNTNKKNHVVFNSYGALNFSVKNLKVNVFVLYQPTFAREISISGPTSIYNEYGVSSLQFGLGVDF